MINIYFNNITNEVLLSSVSGNTVVLKEEEDVLTPVLKWKLDSDSWSTPNFIDEITGATMTVVGTTPTFDTDHNGTANGATDFTYDKYLTSTFANLPNMPTNSEAKTICMWFQGDSNLYTSYNAPSLWISGADGDDSPISKQVLIYSNTNGEFTVSNRGPGYDMIIDPFKPTGNTTFYHIAYTYDGIDDNNIYLDGALVGTSGYTCNDPDSGEAPINIGRLEDFGNSSRWRGRIEDVRVYDVELTPTQVLAVYNE